MNNKLTVEFLHEDGTITKVSNIGDSKDFRDFATKNIRAEWSLYDNIAIKMSTVLKFWEVENK